MRRPSDGFRHPGAQTGGTWGGRGSLLSLTELLPGSNINWEAEARSAWRNSAVAICLSYIQDNIPAPIQVVRTAAGKSTPVDNHPLSALLRRPNPFVSGKLLLGATALSMVVDGNAYWIKRRNLAGRVVRLEYVPHWTMEPGWDDTTDLIGWYSYTPGGGPIQRLPVEDVVHFRVGIDPENLRKGLSRLKPVLREVVTDNEANTYTASILKNMGIPGAIISPEHIPGTPAHTPSAGFKDKLKALWKDKLTGDKRGEPIVLDHGYKVTTLGLSPEDLVLDKIRQIPEARIAAALRVPAMVVGLSVGQQQRTYANMREARQIGYEDAIIPVQDLIADVIDLQLLPDLSTNPDAEDVVFDRSGVGVLQESRNDLYSALNRATGGAFLTPDEARAEMDLPPVEGGDKLRTASAPGQTDPPDPGKTPPDPAKVREEWAQKARARRAAWEAMGIDDGEDE